MQFVCIDKEISPRGTILSYSLRGEDNAVIVLPSRVLAYLMYHNILQVSNLRIDENTNIVEVPKSPTMPMSEDPFAAMIKRKAENDTMIERQRQAVKEQQLQNAFEIMHSLKPRIERIIYLMQEIMLNDPKTWANRMSIIFNKCTTDDFALGTDYLRHRIGGYMLDLKSGELSHATKWVRAVRQENGVISYWLNPNLRVDTKIYLGVGAGGACDDVDFYTDGTEVHCSKTKGLDTFGFKYFLEKFEAYEASFYAWFTQLYGGDFK